MSFTNMQVTNRGRNLLAKAQGGVPLNFTRIRIGSGSFSGVIPELINLVTPVMWVELNKGKFNGDGKYTVGGSFTNAAVTTGFYLRELGVFANDPDLGEILFCYANAGNGAEFVPNNTSSEIIEKQLDINTIVTGAANVTATINDSLVYASKADVEEVASDLTSHETNTGIHVTTAKQAAWDAKETPAGAQSKATTAKSEAIAAAATDATNKANAVQTNLNNHAGNNTAHITAAERTAWNGKANINAQNAFSAKQYSTVNQDTTAQFRNIHLSTAAPTNAQGINGDIWIRYS